MLNKALPFGQVFGMPGVSWEQAGQLFDFAGHPVDGNGLRVEVEAQMPVATRGLEAMHWKQLKVMVEQYGGTYDNVPAAIAFLRGKGQ